MISWLNYSIESSILLALLLLFYRVVLSKEKCIQYNRYYLIAVGILSSLLPLLDLPFISFTSNENILLPVYEIPAIVGQITTFNEPKDTSFLSLIQLASFIYFAGMVVMFVLLCVKLVRIIMLIKASDIFSEEENYKVILTDGTLPTFSFGSFLFLNQVGKNENELRAIIKHEEAHIKQKHSIDILLVELYKIIFWFNPYSYQLANAVRLNHEFLADKSAMKSTGKKAYIETLISHVYKSTITPIVHYFGLHSTEKRIKMITDSVNLSTLYKPYFSAPFIALLVFTFSCHFQPNEVVPTQLGTIEAPVQFAGMFESLKQQHPNRIYYFKFTSNPELENILAKDYAYYSIDYYEAMDDNSGIYGMIYSFDNHRKLPKALFSTQIFKVEEVTELPTPWDGYEALMEEIDRTANTFISPDEDKTVWVRFVVNTIGEVIHTNIVGIDYKTMSNKEAKEYGAAIKAVNATSNKWRIGKINDTIVNVEIELPVRLYKD